MEGLGYVDIRTVLEGWKTELPKEGWRGPYWEEIERYIPESGIVKKFGDSKKGNFVRFTTEFFASKRGDI